MERDVFIIRHGKTALNKEGKALGLSDPELTDEGIEEVQSLMAHLKERGVVPKRIYTSPLRRVLKTAEELQGGLGGIIEQSLALREIDYGAYEGSGKEVLREIQYGYNSEKMRKGNAETVEDVEQRAAAFLNDVFQKEDDCVLIVTSAFVASVMTQVLMDIQRTFETIQPLSTADYTYVRVEKGGENPLNVLSIQRNVLKGRLDI